MSVVSRALPLLVAALLLQGVTGAAAALPATDCGIAATAACAPSGHVVDADPRLARAAAANNAAIVVPTVPARCIGDGTSGARVEVLVAHERNQDIRASVADFRRWTEQAVWTFAASGARSGGEATLRVVTDATADGCEIRVSTVAVGASDLATFDGLVEALAGAGYDRSDRKYLVFADHDGETCGRATSTQDDRPGAHNVANELGYARVDARCWTVGDDGFGSIAAHELTHSMGAVQDSAPNSTGDAHCDDEWDLMCATSAASDTTVRCSDDDAATTGEQDRENFLLDCGGDDYFNAGDPDGYLVEHWNVASSIFLSRGETEQAMGPTSPSLFAGPEPALSPAFGIHRGSLADGTTWDACDLPLGVAVGPANPTVVNLRQGDALTAAVDRAIDWVNGQVGRTVLRTVNEFVADLVFRPTAVTGVTSSTPTRVALTTSGRHITGAVVRVDVDVAGELLDVWARQAMAQALGVGRNGIDGDLMAFWPTSFQDRAGTGEVLAHLYESGACSKPLRLRDTVAGVQSQRRDGGGSRSRLDLATGAVEPVAVAMSVSRWQRERHGDDWADVAVICRDDVHADCLAGSALIGANGPLLFVEGGPSGRLTREVAEELTSSLTLGGRIYVLGGEQAVSPAIVTSLRSVTSDIVRLAGETRFTTATTVADEVVARRDTNPPVGDRDSTTPVAVVARSDDPVDAVAVGAYAARFGVPVVLVTPTTLPNETAEWLARNRGLAVVVGGPVAVGADVALAVEGQSGQVLRVAGENRYATSVAIAEEARLWRRQAVSIGVNSVIALPGDHPLTWTLALAVAPAAAELNGPVLFTRHGQLPESVDDYIRNLPLTAAPDFTSVFVGAGGFATHEIASAWHARAVPGFDGNTTLD